MNYWDSSAILPLLIKERQTAQYTRLQTNDLLATWWGTPVECASALSRKSREDKLAPSEFAAALRLLDELRNAWVEVEPDNRVRQTAIRLLRHHHLRGADALHLASALVVSRFDAHSMRFFTGDTRLRMAAEKEGFVVP